MRTDEIRTSSLTGLVPSGYLVKELRNEKINCIDRQLQDRKFILSCPGSLGLTTTGQGAGYSLALP